jgi:hypothetical protein
MAVATDQITLRDLVQKNLKTESSLCCLLDVELLLSPHVIEVHADWVEHVLAIHAGLVPLSLIDDGPELSTAVLLAHLQCTLAGGSLPPTGA